MAGVDLRMVSYNVHGLRDDRAALATVVRSLAPDVLVVQEAPRRFRWRHRCAELARGLGMVVAVGGLPAVGNLILTDLRVRVDRTWSVRFPLTPGRHLRGAAMARCSVGAARFVVAGSHLATDPEERPRQAELLAAELSRCEEPVLLGADLNDRPGGPAWRVVVGTLVDAGAGGTRAATFPALAPQACIDAIFIDPRVRVREYRVVDGGAAARASDHLPVVADLSLPGPP